MDEELSKEEQIEEKPKVEEKKVEQTKKSGIFEKIKNILIQYNRVLIVARKPDKQEFKSSAKITGIGILLVGFIGFIIYLIYYAITHLGGGGV